RFDADQVHLAAVTPGQGAPGVVEAPDPRARLAVRIRRQRRCRADLHLIPAAQDRCRPDTADPYGAARRIRPAPAGRTPDVSLRARLTLIVVGLCVLWIGLAVGATFGAVQDFDGAVA